MFSDKFMLKVSLTGVVIAAANLAVAILDESYSTALISLMGVSVLSAAAMHYSKR